MVSITVTVGSPPSTLADEITVDGVTMTLDRLMPVSQMADGTYVIVSWSDCEFSISPASAVANSYRGNGTMLNPGMIATQGFDGIAGAAYSSVAAFPYNSALDVEAAGPVSVAMGFQGTYLKSVRKTGITGPNQIETIEKYVPFTFMAATPAEGSFRPGVSFATKTIPGTIGDLNYNVLRSLAMPGAGITLATAEAGNYLRRCLPLFGQAANAAELLRRLQTDTNNYSGNFGKTRGDALMALHSDVSNEAKAAYFIRAVQHGIDVDAACQAGFLGGAGAGQHHGYHAFHFFAAFALDDAAMLARAQALLSNMVSQNFRVTSAHVGLSSGWPTDPGDGNEERYRATYFEEHIDDPAWMASVGSDFRLVQHDSQLTARYRMTADGAMFAELFPVLLLENGPGAISGIEAIEACAGGDAAIDYLDRIATWTPTSYTGSSTSASARATYEAWRGEITERARWTGRPEQISAEDHVAAASGGFTWDFKSAVLATEAVTSRDLRYSLDGGRTGVEVTGVANTGTQTGLIAGTKHWVQLRQASASGAGIWSPNQEGDSERNTVTPTGTPSAAIPVNTSAPKIVYKPYPTWKADWFEDCPSTVPDGVGRLYAGVGYYTGYPGPTFTYLWKNAGASTGVTTDYYDLDEGDAGDAITCDVTATNASGAVTTATAGVTVPATSTIGYLVPSGTLAALPDNFTQRWNATAYTLTYNDGKDKTIDSILVGGNSSSAATNLFWSLDTLPPIGSLADVPEGEMLLLADHSGNNYVQANGVVFRATEASAAAATGYIVEIRWISSSSVKLAITRVSAGSRSTTLSGEITTTNGINSKTRLRVNWKIVGADLVISAKVWHDPADIHPLDDAEPGSWQHTFTDTSPLPSGRLGIGNVQSRSPRRVNGLGVSVDPDVSAPSR